MAWIYLAESEVSPSHYKNGLKPWLTVRMTDKDRDQWHHLGLLETAGWNKVTKFDLRAVAFADRHYSRRKVGSNQFMPPGNTIVLWHPDGAVFGWWRPDPKSGVKQMNGLDGWTCTIFRNESQHRSSLMILEAEKYLKDQTCGPDGMLTYVFDSKIKSDNPGYCFKCAGWVVKGRSADGKKTLLWKPHELAGRSP